MFRSAKRSFIALAVVASSAALTTQGLAGTYAFDSKRADVSFKYYVGFASQSGRFTDLNGVLQFDRQAPQKGSIRAVIKTASLSASAFEAQLKSSDFFNIKVYPEIRFVSRSVRPINENVADFHGDLTLKGVTRPVTLRVAFRPAAPAAGGGARVIANARLKRSAFNMTALSYLVNDEIDIQITAALQEKE